MEVDVQKTKGRAMKKAVKKLALESHRTFDTEYAKLNEAQKQAVDTTDGPVMVVAGPGTGKTQVLALRVAKILQSTHMRPWNILCLTFSKSGTIAMRKRLREIIGPDAYGVTVQTIHGFCNDIITGNPSLFEDWSSRKQISDVERYRSLNKIIDQLLPELQLVNAKSPYLRTRDIIGRISQLKREGVTNREELLRIADTYEAHMQGKSKKSTKAHERNVAAAEKFRDFLEIFFRYQSMLKETSRYDYEDMILHVLQALQEEDWLLASLQERYQYILVDEFQDTNGAQYQLLDLLTEDPTGDRNPNFFVVGDDDQAIYRFQGANLQNILSFHARFPNAPVIPLTVSYRCSQSILDAAESLIENNDERLVGNIEGLDKHLTSYRSESPRASATEKDVPPKMLFAASDMAEPWMIADLIDERLREGIDPNQIAVIVQTNRELIPLYDTFTSRSIPVVLSGKLDLLEHPVVEQALCILKAIEDPHTSALLSDALACACFGCHPADVGALYIERRDSKKPLYDLLCDLENLEIEFRDSKALTHARDTLLDLHNKANQRTVVETLEHVYRDCNLIATRNPQPATRNIDVVDFAAAQEFFDRIKQRALEQPGFTFASLLADLTYYADPEYGDVRLSYDLPHLTQTGVQLMTAHKSKGLEFDTVIITNFREGHWDKRRNPPSIALPEDLLFGFKKDQKTFEKNQDERRVAYVAMTRAKRELIFTCPSELTTGESTKAVSPSGFFAQAGDLSEALCELEHPEHMSTLVGTPLRDMDEEFAAFLKQRIEHFALSPTALNHFLKDPALFLEVDLLQRPQAKEPHFAYGNAVHHVLAKWAGSISEGNPLSKEQMMHAFAEHLEQREILTEKERERLLHLGQQTLDRYFASHLQPPYPIVHKVEYNISAYLGAESIPIKGKIDRIDLREEHSSVAIITDFKTGKPKTEKQIMDYGYHRQLVFYDLVIRNGYKIIEPIEYRLDFVGEGAEDPIIRSFTITEKDRRELTELIENVWEKILALDFTPLS